jgi:hypothetical protein
MSRMGFSDVIMQMNARESQTWQLARTQKSVATSALLASPKHQVGCTMTSGEQSNRENDPLCGSELGSNSELSSSEDEARKIRRLQLMISMVSSVISQDPTLTIEEASELAAGAKRAALAMFPDKELAYDLLYKPRLQRLMRERFRLQ